MTFCKRVVEAPAWDLLVACRTYTTLISNVKGKGRLQQVVDWCGGPSFDGCIVFDECHKAKNFVPGKEAQSTKVSLPLFLIALKPIIHATFDYASQLPNAAARYCR